MPLRFHCSHCRQRLSVSSRKRGQEVKCPRCRRVIQVPERDSADTVAPDAADEQEFEGVEQRAELVYADRDEPRDPHGDGPGQVVTIPRYVLYTQGFLLGLVALVFFVFGLIVGSRSRSEPMDATASRSAVVSGSVSYQGPQGRAMPDAGSVVLLLPAAKRPDQKGVAAGLRIEDREPEEGHPALGMLRSLGGDYARADRSGRFRVRAAAPGRYFLLVVSKHERRSTSDSPAPSELAQLGRYFVPATDLLGEQRYRWQELLVRRDEQVDVSF
jgi:phage FluMu protein Com